MPDRHGEFVPDVPKVAREAYPQCSAYEACKRRDGHLGACLPSPMSSVLGRRHLDALPPWVSREEFLRACGAPDFDPALDLERGTVVTVGFDPAVRCADTSVVVDNEGRLW